MSQQQSNQYAYHQELYEQHIQQLDQIKNEIEAQDPFIITQPIELQILESEYLQNQGFLQKIQKIRQSYPQFRRVRRDGSCFYRAVLFRIFEYIIESKDQQILDKFSTIIANSKADLTAVGYEQIVIDDFYDEIMKQIKLCPNNITIQGIVDAFCNKVTSDYLIMYMRMMTSGYIKANSFLFEGYIETGTVELFCQQEVDPIDREADQMQIIALQNYLQIPIRIFYLDGNVSTFDATIFQIPEDADSKSIFINLLYRPGHYDILYPK
ncbi:unnamed protein product (macronuclear) [Paramecium tetraurelia]|uniref:ubiquitinyl hydrolase 1 n=1 Tax=Paramecium tetraurelia TaxID=5888 RepID=A0E9B0_PARTE|nr:uncharacterized protein GSPATT00024608001 [Paramecium tetraurelia]CAK91877.1 unnamed protein product [Paramecium tetraurelia]|eukprot:XP_001459274.1 hypothetical protein (macronuclear) [Paramecium tetraurelia strain d4-2]